MKIRTIDIVVPCYNEADVLTDFFKEVRRVEDSLEDCTFRYIFVDDGSRDETLEVIKGLEAEAAPGSVRYISFSRNFGKEAAMYAGITASAKGDSQYTILMDADLQHPPAMIPDMIAKAELTGCDSVATRRVTRKGEPKIRSFFARQFYKIMNRFSEIEIADGSVDFRLMSHRMVKSLANLPERNRFSKGLFAWVGFSTEWLEFENVKRISGESKWSVWSLSKYAIGGFIDFADSPLKFIGIIGSFISAGSAIYFIYEFLKTIIMGKDLPGYASMFCMLLFFGGAIIAILALIGEYIGRMYIEIKGRPVYIEKESNFDK